MTTTLPVPVATVPRCLCGRPPLGLHSGRWFCGWCLVELSKTARLVEEKR